ncbi:MAG: hypothetical protein OXF41_11965 [bacterium]|nr:hypothetical protein [bacterium]
MTICSGPPPADPGGMLAIGRPLVDCSAPPGGLSIRPLITGLVIERRDSKGLQQFPRNGQDPPEHKPSSGDAKVIPYRVPLTGHYQLA